MSSEMPLVTLFVKAGADGKRYGACPFCQRIFMILIIKAESNLLTFRVATVNLAKPPEEFKKLTLRRVPAIVHEDDSLDNVDDIVEYLDVTFPTPNLIYEDAEAVQVSKDLFQKFCFFVKEVSKDSSHLVAELAKLDDYISKSGKPYICSTHLTHLDCELLPKLHHIRVAANYLKKFEINGEFKSLWRYFKQAYHTSAFMKSCPSDQEIILHWADKPETRNLTMEQHSQITKELPAYTTKVPE